MTERRILNIYPTNIDALFNFRDHVNGLTVYNCPFSQSVRDGLVIIHANEKSGEVRVVYKSFGNVTIDDILPADEINFEGEVSKELAILIFKERENEQDGF